MTIRSSHQRFQPLLILGLSALLLGGFIKLTSEFREGEATAVDQALLTRIARHRSEPLTRAVKIVTTLGSPAVLTSMTVIGLTCLCLKHRWHDAGYLIVAGIGMGIMTPAMKHYIARARPGDVFRLTESGGFSYPSGHTLGSTSLYVFLAFLIGSPIRDRRLRMLLALLTWGLVMGISLSRLYLGVHYPSDVLSGFFLGLAWATLLAAIYLYRSKQTG